MIRKGHKGFTFVEILAAMVFMAVVIPAVIEGLTLANRTGLVAQRKRVAAQLADGKLSELVVTQQTQGSAPAGDFGADHPGYRWTIKSDQWAEDGAMRLVTIQVWYKVQEREYEVHLSTLVSGVTT